MEIIGKNDTRNIFFHYIIMVKKKGLCYQIHEKKFSCFKTQRQAYNLLW